MKKLIATSLLLASSLLIKAQQAESSKFFNAADPTQLYTNVNLNAGIIGSSNSGIFGPEYWRLNLGGEFTIEKFNFGFNIPFSNLGNFYTLLGDIDFHAGFQPFNRDKLFKSSLITVGVTLPTSYNYHYNDTWLNSTRRFYLDYTASLKFNDKISVFPKVGLEKGSNIDENVPRFNLTSYKASLGGSYQINPKNFLQFNLDYAYSTRKLVEETNSFYNFQNTLESNSILTSLKYQYAITPKAQVYTKINVDFGERFENYYHDFNSTETGLFLGFQCFIK